MSDLYGGSVDTNHTGNHQLAELLKKMPTHYRHHYESMSITQLEREQYSKKTPDRGMAREVLRKKKLQAKSVERRMSKDKAEFEKARKELRKIVGTKGRKVTEAQFERARARLKEEDKTSKGSPALSRTSTSSKGSSKLGRKIVGTKKYKKDKSV